MRMKKMKKASPKILYNDHALQVLEFDRVREIVASLAHSEKGRALLSETTPCTDAVPARELLSEAAEYMDALRFDDPPPAADINDISEILPFLRIEGYNLGIEAIAWFAGNLETAGTIKRYFHERKEKYNRIEIITGELEPHEDIVREIHKVITPDLEIADNATPELRSIRRKLAQSRSVLRNLVEKTLDKLPDEVVSDRLVTVRNGRFVIPVRDSMKKKVPGSVQDRSQTGKTLFIEPLESIEANNQVRELELAEKIEIERILKHLSKRIASEANDIKHNQNILIRMDVIAAKAHFGVMVDGVVPVINDEPELSIKKGRHPLLEWKYRKSGTSEVIPLDFSTGGSVSTVVITGPNAGGKTVVLKTVGLLTVMALSGIPVPAGQDTAVFAPTGIFADIGDEQSIENDVSTFTSHIINIVTILNEAGPGALVLLDELGGATNPADGEAIALAILKKLTGIGVVTLATTHHEGLKVFAYDTDGVINASMEFDKEHLRPAFMLRTGIPGSSYAFEIAARMGFPDAVLRDAESLAGGERKSLEGLIAEMEEHVRKADEERKIAERERLHTAKVKADYESKLSDFNDKKQALMREAIEESQTVMKDANRSIESAIRAIKENNASREAIAEAKKLVRQQTETIQKAAQKLPKKTKVSNRKPITELYKGLIVWVESLDADAVVEEVLDSGKKARVRVGSSKASVVLTTRNLSQSTASKKIKQKVTVNVYSSSVDSQEIDLRGMIFDEAREELDIFLDRLHMAGIETAHIIHGKGTGALRSKIGGYLENHPYIESQRLGYWNEGSAGVTVATLKK